MLSHEQLLHFAEHGWVLEEDVFEESQIDAYKDGLERMAEEFEAAPSGSGDIVGVTAMVNYERIFRDWIMTPNILEANRQLMGAEIKYECCHATIKSPHPDRETERDQLRDPERMSWHRGLRPKWGVVPHDTDESLINSTFLNNITYLTNVAPTDGGTMVLDGSHRHEGDFKSLKDELPIVELTAPRGSVLHFTECLIHKCVPILSENVRYTMFYGFTPSWYVTWPNCEASPQVIAGVKDEELKAILGGRCGYVGQEAVI
jgi:hypothetical protein